MKPIQHVIISASTSAIYGLWIKSFPDIIVCFFSGIFIDIDHYLDYYLNKGKFPWNYKLLSDYCATAKVGKIFLFLHAYEFLFLFWVIIYTFSLNSIWISVALGFTVHILCDELFNPLKFKSYFLTYRLKQNFERQKLLKKEYLQAP